MSTPETKTRVGVHVVADIRDADPDRLRDGRGAVNVLARALAAEDFTVLNRIEHVFPGPGGFTALFLLSESHLSVHTYPELGYAAFDLFSCGTGRPEPVLDAAVRFFEGRVAQSEAIERQA